MAVQRPDHLQSLALNRHLGYTGGMLILASASPRRRELLTAAGVVFSVRPADVDETPRPGEDPDRYVLRMAKDKAFASRMGGFKVDDWFLSADTAVIVDRRILGKPVDRAQAVEMLTLLEGRAHRVVTAVCLLKAGDDTETALFPVSTTVRFKALSRREIDGYAATDEPYDKAGAYAAQGMGAFLIEAVEGSYTNVIGLPLSQTLDLLATHGVARMFDHG